jgi:hypothetical protein
LFGLSGRDLIVGGGGGDDGEQVGEFLHDLVRRRNQEMRMRRVFGVLDEKSAGALADPLDEPFVAGALDERLDAVERIVNSAAGLVLGGFGPFVDDGGGQADVSGDLFGRGLVKNFAEQFVGLHGVKMVKRRKLGKREAIPNFGPNCKCNGRGNVV